jgi:nicotinamidase/pyrazinamidase
VPRALIVVDVQNDFTEGGPFAGSFSFGGNDAVARRIGSYVADHHDRYDLVVTTQDWHIEPGEHFVKHPIHCVAGTPGAELDAELDAGAGVAFANLVDLQLHKGLYADDYSGFKAIDDRGVTLPALLESAGITEIDVCGFAEDGCVSATVADGLAEGYAVRLLTDLSAATTPEAAARVEAELASAGATIATTGAPVRPPVRPTA